MVKKSIAQLREKSPYVLKRKGHAKMMFSQEVNKHKEVRRMK